LAVCIADPGVHIVVIQNRSKSRVSKDAPEDNQHLQQVYQADREGLFREDLLSTRSVDSSMAFKNNRAATIGASNTIFVNLDSS
jgi:hypothetical protein